MKVKKRLCCLVLVVCLTISLFPVNAFATSGISSQYSDEEIEEIMSQCPYTVTGGSYGESYVYDVTSQKLTLYSGTLSVSGTPNKSDPACIEVAPNSVLELTIRDVSPVSDVNGGNGGPGLKIGANATVDLVLAGENMFCRGWDDIHNYSVYLDNNAKVTVSGNGSLICKRNFGYPKLYLSDTAEFIIKSGSVQFKGGQNPNSHRNPHTVGGSGKLVVDGGTVLVADEVKGKVFSDNPSIELKNGELQFNYDREFGNCRLKMDGGILKLRQDKEFSFTNLQYNAGTFDVTKAIRFNGQTTINSSLVIPENATFIIPSGQTMIFANGTKLTVSSGGTLQNDGVIKYFCQDTSIPAAVSGNGTTEASHIYDQKVVNDKYLKTPATCINLAVYYMSCVCGEKGTETFENGDALGHSWGSWQSNGDDTHTRTCQICAVKETENCTGGTATCVNKAICSVCNAEHGAVDPTNHTGTEAWITTDTMHTKVWRCCQAVIEAEEEHNWENGTCTICQYPCQHTGGTATCSQLAVCDICGSQYGDYDADNHKAVSAWTQENGKHYHKCEYGCDTHLDEAECSGGTATCTAQALCAVCGGTYGAVDPANHTGTEAWITTDTTHTKVWRCCQAVIEAEEEHNWENGTCTICQYPCQHTGGTATCSQLAVCDICGSQYGDYDADNHKAVSAWTQENGKHYHKCEYGCDTHLDEAECSGGEATCTAPAVCETCGNAYGAINPDNHTGTVVWTKTATTHSSAYSCCNAPVVAEEVHEWQNGVCSECGYECQHDGGTATCTQKAVCDICGEEYGEVNASNHTNLIKTEAKPATHMTEGNIEYWYCDGCGKYFSDEAGTKEIALANTVIPKLTEHTADGTGWHSDETNHWNTCECGEKLNEAAHTFEWVTDKEATATEAGSRHKECTVCGYEEAAVEIPATGTTDPSEPPTDTDKPSGDQTGDTTSPQTGDDSNIALWMALMLAAGAVLTGTAVYSRKRKYSR